LSREANIGSVSGALARKIKKWVQSIPPEKLEWAALNFPKEPWRELADVIHLAPTDFQLPWFLEVCFGKEPPKDTQVSECSNLKDKPNILELIKKYKVPYSYIRKELPEVSSEIKSEVARYETLNILIWWYEELGTAGVDEIINQRLTAGEQPTLPYGKLMERLLYFKRKNVPFLPLLIPIAEKELKKIKIPLEPPVVVLGDASYSMDVAIRVATVIGSLLTALTNADLKFFNVESVRPSVVPSTIPQVLDVATNVKADGLTAPACTIYEYYVKKEIVRFFIVVTDEIENVQYKGYFFPTLFEKYYKEVYPAKIVFVSFLENPKEKGRMVKALESLNIIPLQFRLDATRPDLTKLDTLLGLLSSESSFFEDRAKDVATALQSNGLQQAVGRISEPSYMPTTTTTTTTTSSSTGDNLSKSEGKKPEVFAPQSIRIHLKHNKTGVQKGFVLKNGMKYKELLEEVKKRFGETRDIQTIKTSHGDDVSNDDDVSFINDNDNLDVTFVEIKS